MSCPPPNVPCVDWMADWCGKCSDLALEHPCEFERAKDIAIATVFRLTYSRYTGICETTIRPCKQNKCCGGSYSGPWGHQQYPSYIMARGDTFYNAPLPTDCYSDNCDCSGADCITLPYGPVCEVTEVKVDGVVLDSSEYFLKNNKELCRIGGLWPTCQDLSKNLTEADTWSVKFKHGVDVPIDLAARTAEFACEIAKLCLNLPCLLPQKISVNSGQVVVDPLVFIGMGLTGYAPLDALIKGMNKHGALRPARVINTRKRRQGPSIVYP